MLVNMWRTLALISKSTAKLQKNIDVGKFYGNNRSRKWILQAKCGKRFVNGLEFSY